MPFDSPPSCSSSPPSSPPPPRSRPAYPPSPRSRPAYQRLASTAQHTVTLPFDDASTPRGGGRDSAARNPNPEHLPRLIVPLHLVLARSALLPIGRRPRGPARLPLHLRAIELRIRELLLHPLQHLLDVVPRILGVVDKDFVASIPQRRRWAAFPSLARG